MADCKICKDIPEVESMADDFHHWLPKFTTQFRDTGNLIKDLPDYYDLQLIKYKEKYCLYHYEEISSFEQKHCLTVINSCPMCGRVLTDEHKS